MMRFEYKVLPAPRKGRKDKGVKAPEDRFARALEQAINALAAEGWEFLRAETLPSDERSGLTSTQTVYRDMLVFRRTVESGDEKPGTPDLAGLAAVEAIPDPAPMPAPDPAPGPAAPEPRSEPATEPPINRPAPGAASEEPGPKVIFRAPPRETD